MKHILIVEDNMELARELKVLLERNNYNADYLTSFGNIMTQLEERSPDMVLLDINLPGVDGESILKQYRTFSDTPVIVVTSKNTDMDELLSMSFGADDFIPKPYNPSILLLHIEAVFKRIGKSDSDDILRYQDIVLEPSRGVITVNGQSVELTKNEMGILSYMFKAQGKIVSRDELISWLWDSDEFVDDNTLTVNINRVRRKLEECGYHDIIKTKRGQGYILE
ncbi:MAG: response regulator transcription factor [Clostridium sp.]|nr:response regulator transcription factor [Clostridium sp.]MCM1398500.1 response regulator transcription factor [Clostridium sp.]MCM1460222.1 response regulator transcription factor [Bacteroides sp.]